VSGSSALVWEMSTIGAASVISFLVSTFVRLRSDKFDAALYDTDLFRLSISTPSDWSDVVRVLRNLSAIGGVPATVGGGILGLRGNEFMETIRGRCKNTFVESVGRKRTPHLAEVTFLV
jgi:hypothetical protein